MQDRPTAAELLRALAELLRDEVLPAVDGPLRHRVRVAANLCGILERESARGGDDAAQASLRRLLGRPDDDAAALLRALDRRLADDDADFARAAWPVLLAIVRAKLAVDKPGHDDYDFAVDLAP